MRIGVGRPVGDDVAGYVLRPFDGDERVLLDGVLEKVVDAVTMIHERGITEAMDRFNEMDDSGLE